MPTLNPVPYSIASGLGAAEGYRLGHEKDKDGSHLRGLAGAGLGVLGGSLGYHASHKQLKTVKEVAESLGREMGIIKDAGELPSLHDLPSVSSALKSDSLGEAGAGLGTGMGVGLGSHFLAKALYSKHRAPAALAAMAGAALGDTLGRKVYDNRVQARLMKSKNKYVRRLAEDVA